MPEDVRSLEELLQRSSASDDFKKAVAELAQGKNPSQIRFPRGLPTVKILRVISKLLEVEPTLGIGEVELAGRSGCSDFVGELSVNNGQRRYRFDWDCHWRAEQEGMKDHWGMVDQARAAQTFGYQCFKLFEPVD